MAVHVPLSDEAVREARELMLSSHNLLKPASGEPIVGPSKDMVLGMYWLTGEKPGVKGEGKAFGNMDEVKLAYDLGAVDLRAKIRLRYHDWLRDVSLGNLHLGPKAHAALEAAGVTTAAQVIGLIGGLQPDLVIMSSYRYKQVGAASGRDPDTVWQEGIDLTVSKVRPLTTHLLLLGDSPTPKEDIPSCLAGNLSNVAQCMDSRDGAVRPARLAGERDVARKYDADFVPTSDWLCTDAACPVIVGNVLMYRDNSHITATAAELLSPYLEAAVKSILGG